MKITPTELNERLTWPLNEKIKHALSTFFRFYIHFRGHVYQSFSGGKDSQVLDWIIQEAFRGRWSDFLKIELTIILDELGMIDEVCGAGRDRNLKLAYQKIICDRIFQIPPKVFCDTGLEFPEIRKHVRTFENVIWMKPKMKFPDVIKNIGVAVGSKKIASQVRRLTSYLSNPQEKNKATTRLYLTGIKKDGTKSKNFMLSKKWQRLLTAPFKTSDQCCDIFKKEPWHRYKKETGRHGITATTVVESMQRRSAYLMSGCNTFEKGKEMSRPLSIFTEADVWMIAELYGIRFCEVYYDRTVSIPDGDGGTIEVFVMAEKRTGCMFCLFGIHLEPKDQPNRFQRLAITHPKQYAFMLNSCGLGSVLDFIGIEYRPTAKTLSQVSKQYSLPI